MNYKEQDLCSAHLGPHPFTESWEYCSINAGGTREMRGRKEENKEGKSLPLQFRNCCHTCSDLVWFPIRRHQAFSSRDLPSSFLPPAVWALLSVTDPQHTTRVISHVGQALWREKLIRGKLTNLGSSFNSASPGRRRLSTLHPTRPPLHLHALSGPSNGSSSGLLLTFPALFPKTAVSWVSHFSQLGLASDFFPGLQLSRDLFDLSVFPDLTVLWIAPAAWTRTVWTTGFSIVGVLQYFPQQGT